MATLITDGLRLSRTADQTNFEKTEDAQGRQGFIAFLMSKDKVRLQMFGPNGSMHVDFTRAQFALISERLVHFNEKALRTNWPIDGDDL